MKDPKLKLDLLFPKKYEGRVFQGKYNYGWDNSPKVQLYMGDTKLYIGSFCSFAPRCIIHVGGEHFTDYVSTYPFSAIFKDVPTIPCVGSKGDIIIGSDVWIGEGVTILSGVRIGHGAVIGAETVLTKSVPPYTIVGGNPARGIKTRFKEHQIEQLLSIEWWEWSDEEIDKAIPYLMQTDIDKFIEYAVERRGVNAIQ